MAQRVFERFAEVARAVLGTEVAAIFEVGTRDCAETLDFHRGFPGARIFAFECNPATLPACRAAVAGKERIRLVEKAVSDRPGSVSFFPTDPARTVTGEAGGNPGASSMFRATGDYPLETYVQNEITVEATTLERVMQDEGVAAIDLLWMDIQGAELLALKGLGARLDTVKLIHLEVEFFRIYEGQPLFADLHDFLSARGFVLLGFTSYSRFAADAIYARRGVLQGPLSRWQLARRFPYLLRNRLKQLKHRLKWAILGRPVGGARS